MRKKDIEAGLAVIHAVRDKHGMNCEFSKTEIADMLGCSVALIYQIERDALKKLRHDSNAEMLLELLGESKHRHNRIGASLCY